MKRVTLLLGVTMAMATTTISGCASPAVSVALNLLGAAAGGSSGAPPAAAPVAGQELIRNALGQMDNTVKRACTDSLPPPPRPEAADPLEDTAVPIARKCEMRLACLPGMDAPVRVRACTGEKSNVVAGALPGTRAQAGGAAPGATDISAPWSFQTPRRVYD